MSTHNGSLNRISKIHADHLIECRARAAFTCHRPVNPGLIQAHDVYAKSDSAQTHTVRGGRGPTRDISFFNTLKNCGSSSRLLFRRNLPTGVILGSLTILYTPLIH